MRATTFAAILATIAIIFTGVTSPANARVTFDEWKAEKEYQKGECVGQGSPATIIYECKITGTTQAPPHLPHWKPFEPWDSTEDYKVGAEPTYVTYVMREPPYPPLPFIFLLLADNKDEVPKDNPDYWREPVPEDKPSFDEGEGPSGNDWLDFDIVHAQIINTVLLGIRDGKKGYENNKAIAIPPDSPHFSSDCCRSDGPDEWSPDPYYHKGKVVKVTNGSEVKLYQCATGHDSAQAFKPPHVNWIPDATTNMEHIHYKEDYDDVDLVEEGNDFWDWSYHRYLPPVVRGGNNCTVEQNCFAYGLDNCAGNKTPYWINPDVAVQALVELVRVEEYGNWDLYDTRAEDRCRAPTVPLPHLWVIRASPTCSPATSMQWKNSSSPVYTWAPAPPRNNAPIGLNMSVAGTPPEPTEFDAWEIHFSEYDIWRAQ